MRAVVAVDENWGIGCRGQLLFRISADLKRFRALTMGGAVVLGRKTLATLPGGRPLPGRRNLILSRDPGFRVEGGEVFPSIPALLAAGGGDAVVIGGGSVYRQLLEYCDQVYVTKVFAAPEADTWFPDLDADPAWTAAAREPVMEEGGLKFRYVTYERRDL